MCHPLRESTCGLLMLGRPDLVSSIWGDQIESSRARHGVCTCDSSFTCQDYSTYGAHPWSPSPLRRAYPWPDPHNRRCWVRLRGTLRRCDTVGSTSHGGVAQTLAWKIFALPLQRDGFASANRRMAQAPGLDMSQLQGLVGGGRLRGTPPMAHCDTEGCYGCRSCWACECRENAHRVQPEQRATAIPLA